MNPHLICILIIFYSPNINSQKWYLANIDKFDNKIVDNGTVFLNKTNKYLQNNNETIKNGKQYNTEHNSNHYNRAFKVKDTVEATEDINFGTNLNNEIENEKSITNNTLSYDRTFSTHNIIKTRKKNRCHGTRPRKKKQINQRKSRFLEVFQVVEFDHVACESSTGLEGKCLHEYECGNTGGAPMGECADGYGTCCVLQVSCGDQTNVALSWFTNPAFPSPSSERLSCAITLDKISPEITQIRLDFMTFELQPPNYGTCEQDQFVVSGQNINSFIPILCGVNTGQHMYIEVGDVVGPVYLSIQTVSPETRLFAIKISQLGTFDSLAAPPGCLQYFTEERGSIESFNYQDISAIAIARKPSYLNNLNYAMCIKRGTNMCSISYSNVADMQIINYDTDGLPVIPPGQAGVEIFNCPSDWLLIAAARLCGDRLNDGSVLQDFSLDAPVTDVAAGPIVVWFKSDGAVTGRGFKLEYQQNGCISPA